jgi:hypothetical protein
MTAQQATRPQTIHLNELWERPEAVTAKDQVAAMLETPGWARLLEAIDARLRTEQRTMMRTRPGSDQEYDRIIGRWAGMSDIAAFAEGIVKHGKEVETQLRQEEAA